MITFAIEMVKYSCYATTLGLKVQGIEWIDRKVY